MAATTGGSGEAGSGKGSKSKFKGKTIDLNEFLDKPLPRFDWAAEMAAEDARKAEEATKVKAQILEDRTALPKGTKATQPDAGLPKLLANLDDVPAEPPFLARLSNVDYAADENTIREHYLAELGITVEQVKMPRDRATNTSRGMAIVKFTARDELITALKHSGQQILQREIRVEIADQERNPDLGGRLPPDGRPPPALPTQDARMRDGYRPPPPPPQQEEFRGPPGYGDRGGRGGYGGGGGGYQQQRPQHPPYNDYPRDQHYPPQQQHYQHNDRGGYNRGGARGPPSAPDYANYGGRQGGGHVGGGHGGQRVFHNQQHPEFANQQHQQHHPPNHFPPQHQHPQQPHRGGGYGGGGYPGGPPGPRRREDIRHSTDSAPAVEEAPRERRKLNLLPRSKSDAADDATAAPTPKPNIFGDARPVDTAAREAEIERKIAEERAKTERPLKVETRRRTSERTLSTGSMSGVPPISPKIEPSEQTLAPGAGKVTILQRHRSSGSESNTKKESAKHDSKTGATPVIREASEEGAVGQNGAGESAGRGGRGGRGSGRGPERGVGRGRGRGGGERRGSGRGDVGPRFRGGGERGGHRGGRGGTRPDKAEKTEPVVEEPKKEEKPKEPRKPKEMPKISNSPPPSFSAKNPFELLGEMND